MKHFKLKEVEVKDFDEIYPKKMSLVSVLQLQLEYDNYINIAKYTSHNLLNKRFITIKR